MKSAKVRGNKFNKSNMEVSMKNNIWDKAFENSDHEILLGYGTSIEMDYSGEGDETIARTGIYAVGSRKFNQETGEEVGAADVVTPALKGIYVPSEEMDFDAELEAGYVSNASLCLTEDEAYVYERDFGEMINDAYEEDIMVTATEMLTKEQQDINFNFYLNKLNACKTPKELYAWKDELLADQRDSFSGLFMLAAGKSKELWSLYHVAKHNIWNDINNKQDEDMFRKVSEYASLIVQYSDYGMLKRISDEIYADFIPVEVKKVLWTKIRQKNQGEYVSFDTTKMKAYVVEQMQAMRAKRLANKQNKSA